MVCGSTRVVDANVGAAGDHGERVPERDRVELRRALVVTSAIHSALSPTSIVPGGGANAIEVMLFFGAA